MTKFNPQLLKLASHQLETSKEAFVPPGGGDPAAMGGMPPGGAPPMDPAMGGMPPGMPPGGAPPMDPAMGGMPPGAPPMDPAMMGGMPPAPAPPADPAAAAGPGGAGQKIKPDQMMQIIDTKFHHMQMMLSSIAGALGVSFPPDVLVDPPAAEQVAKQEQQQQADAGGGDAAPAQPDSAIKPIEGIQPAMPGAAPEGGGDAGGVPPTAPSPKTASVAQPGYGVSPSVVAQMETQQINPGPNSTQEATEQRLDKIAALAAMSRSLGKKQVANAS